MASSRERLLAALRRKPVNRLPWTALITDYYLNSLPPTVRLASDREVLEHVGADLLQIGPMGLAVTTRDAHVETVGERHGDTVTTTLTTPQGSMREERRATEAGTSFRTQFFIRDAQDCRAMQYVYSHRQCQANYQPLRERLEALGDGGLLAYWAPRSPLQMLLEELAGLETTVFLLSDHRQEVESLMRTIHERNCEVYAILAESPAEFVVSVEDTSTTMISPRLFAQYVAPCLNEYSAILHAAGKIHGAHMCGHLRDLLPQIRDLDVDGIESLTPFPTGNTSLAQAQHVLANKFIIGGLDAPSLKRKTPDEVRAWVRDIVQSLNCRDGIVLEVTDDVSSGTPLENLRAIGEAVQEFG